MNRRFWGLAIVAVGLILWQGYRIQSLDRQIRATREVTQHNQSMLSRLPELPASSTTPTARRSDSVLERARARGTVTKARLRSSLHEITVEMDHDQLEAFLNEIRSRYEIQRLQVSPKTDSTLTVKLAVGPS